MVPPGGGKAHATGPSRCRDLELARGETGGETKQKCATGQVFSERARADDSDDSSDVYLGSLVVAMTSGHARPLYRFGPAGVHGPFHAGALTRNTQILQVFLPGHRPLHQSKAPQLLV